ncbi:5-oxoprolinase subunit PxpB [Aureitalea marina]|uniref:Carboxyltransferase domain-containing protein n=1 Tax=Aureitalea marina TaxID=930804 RepID=A0A2S7KNF4_9FLAO|nr:5-oxoprolinase subunit PxpB [Aureitalea marina]PQB04164.1 hypothetical protein BST85_04045 [Aureitalea marina]
MRPEIKQFGDKAVLLEFPPHIDPQLHRRVMQWTRFLELHFQKDILNVVPSYASIAIYLNSHVEVETIIQNLKVSDPLSTKENPRRKWHYTLPVCYADSMAPDMSSMCESLSLTPEQLIRLHTKPTYLVYFIGFLPGFPYLGGLDSQLHFPRKDSPRPLVAKGSVGIGGQQTGIYPQDSPGGWNLIGHCPVPLFDPGLDTSSLLAPGDQVSFQTISLEEHEEISELIIRSDYQVGKTEIHD